MRTIYLLAVFLFFNALCYSQTKNIYISGNGNDNNNGSLSSPVKTLEKAYALITSPGQITYNVILIEGRGDIHVSNSSGEILTWAKSGSSSHPINIYSYSKRANLVQNNTNPNHYWIKLKNVNYININDIIFKDIKSTCLFLNNVNYCKITYNIFRGVIEWNSHVETIWIGHYNPGSPIYSTYNKVNHNFFDGSKCVNIYVSEYNKFNEFAYNTFYNEHTVNNPKPDPVLQFNHCHQENNNVAFNIVRQNAPRSSFYMDHETHENDLTIKNNSIHYNYVYQNSTNDLVEYDLSSRALAKNTIQPNFNCNNYKPYDPYWLDFDPDAVNNKIVSGDFNGDGITDIAAFYSLANNTGRIDLWKSRSDNSFEYINSAWNYTYSYPASKYQKRVVAGDFDRDGKDEIAVFFYYGGGDTRIHVWNLVGDKFKNSSWNPGWWKSNGSYTAGQINDKIVVGDFNNDGRDDIAAFYDDWGSGVYLHVFTSTGSKFNNPQTWWQNNSWYPSERIEGRVVSGNFNGTGADEIAVLFDYGNGDTRIHVWTSTGSRFNVSNYNPGWWRSPGNYHASKVTGRVVSADFDGNGKDDIATLYDLGSNKIKFDVFRSSGSSFYNPIIWWQNNSWYPSGNIKGRVIAGEFGGNSRDDICVFMEYPNDDASLRSHVFQAQSSYKFSMINSSLGFPWLMENSVVFISRPNKYDLPKSVKEAPLSKSDVDLLKVYPNPASSELYVEFNLIEASSVQIELYSLTGVRVKSQFENNLFKGNQSIKVLIDDLPNGIYILKTKTGSDSDMVKILINR